MKKNYQLLPLLLLFLLALSARAQTPYVYSTLAPYSQNFDGMGTTAGANKSPITPAAVPGIVTGYVNAGQSTFNQLTAATANDGSNSATYVYNFGTNGATDRALGGIAGTFTGLGYIAARLVNSTGAPIRNFDVRYAFEQWYNSTIATDAKFHVYYRIYPSSGTAFANSDLTQIVDTTNYTNWTRVANLDLAAPATGATKGQCDGNSATYRRAKEYRIKDVNLEAGAEIVFCFEYTFSNSNNGNGMAIDDIVIYPENNILYSGTTGNLDDASNWFADGSAGANPVAADFTADNYVYFVQGTNTAGRISSNGWQITGANSRVVVGASTSSTASLTLASGNVIGSAAHPVTLDVTGGSTLSITDVLSTSATPRSYLTLGTLAANTTVTYSATATQNVLPGTYYNLSLAGGNSKILTGNAIVGNNLNLAQPVKLGSFNLIIQRGATITRPNSSGQVLADGTGELRATVIGAGSNSMPVLFPVSTTADKANYYPVSVTAGSSDRDETYRVRIIDSVYPSYNASGTPSGTASANTNNINKTWLISHETTNSVSATVELGWPAAVQGSTFVPAFAYLDHYDVSGGTGWEKGATNSPGAFTHNGQQAVQRTGVSNFSPFAVTSNADGPLPVTLVAFAAQRTAGTVRCTWTTASELNSDHFDVERSLDGVSFAKIGQQAGQGNSATDHQYAFADVRPLSTLAYYRLRQVDADGTATYSPVVTVGGIEAGSTVAVVALPNPGTGEFVLQTAFEVPALVQATVINTLGQQVLRVAQLLPAGSASLPLDLDAQPAGLYLVQLTTPGGAQTLRLLKQ